MGEIMQYNDVEKCDYESNMLDGRLSQNRNEFIDIRFAHIENDFRLASYLPASP